MILRAREYVSIKGMFLVILGSYGGPLGSWMCNMASLDVGEIGGSGRLGQGRNLGPPVLILKLFLFCFLLSKATRYFST